MLSKKLAAAFTALSLLAGSSAAAAQSAAPLSLAASPAAVRAGAAQGHENELRGGYGWILAVVALGIVVFILIEIGDDNALPESA